MSLIYVPDLYINTQQEFNSGINEKRFIYFKSGSNAKCYIFNRNNRMYLLKVFKDNNLLNIKENDVLAFRDIQNDFCHFNRAGFYIENRFRGVIREYVNGECMNEIIYTVPFHIIQNACGNYEDNMWIITKKGIEVDDTTVLNTLWNNTEFKLIDTDSYKWATNINSNELYKQNMSSMPQNLISSLFSGKYLRLISGFGILSDIIEVIEIKNGSKKEKFITLKEGISITPSELIKRIKTEIQSCFNKNIVSINDTLPILEKVIHQ